MQIVQRIDDFLLELFPKYQQSNKDLAVLKQELSDYYTFEPYRPKISIQDEWITIDIDVSTIVNQEADFRKVVSLCEEGRYIDAKKILVPLIDKNPTNSEYHRIYAQILSEEGNQDAAINSLIDALRWNPKNGWALILMGNIFAKEKNDLETAKKYYDQSHVVNPKDNIALNNIGANLMQQGKIAEAKVYFERLWRLIIHIPILIMLYQ